MRGASMHRIAMTTQIYCRAFNFLCSVGIICGLKTWIVTVFNTTLRFWKSISCSVSIM